MPMLSLLAIHSNVIVVSLPKRKAIFIFRWSPFSADLSPSASQWYFMSSSATIRSALTLADSRIYGPDDVTPDCLRCPT